MIFNFNFVSGQGMLYMIYFFFCFYIFALVSVVALCSSSFVHARPLFCM